MPRTSSPSHRKCWRLILKDIRSSITRISSPIRDWQQALSNSFTIAPIATLLATAFGTLAAIGLSQSHVPFRRAIMAILISPMIVPLIISAAGMYFFYSRVGSAGTPIVGVVLAHAALGTPFRDHHGYSDPGRV